jgi:hypothetical protein
MQEEGVGVFPITASWAKKFYHLQWLCQAQVPVPVLETAVGGTYEHSVL